MIDLIDGLGQLGTVLKKAIEEQRIIAPESIAIYHTWNFLDKSEQTQRQCYDVFTRFIKANPRRKIIFTSTYSETDNPYNYYKQLSEAFLLSNHEKGYVIKLPTLIGKGIFEKFRDEKAEAFGNMEIMLLEDAAQEVLRVALANTKVRSFRAQGTIVPAKIVKGLILFGKHKR